MAKKTFNDELYGKITYKEEGYWLLKDGIRFRINNKEIEVKTEVDIYNSLYEKFNMGLLIEELMVYYR